MDLFASLSSLTYPGTATPGPIARSVTLMLRLAFGVNLGLDIFVTLLHVTVIGFTFLRVHYRKRTHRLWWDDFTASLAVLIDCGYVTILWFSYSAPGSILHSKASRVARYWLVLELFFIVIWMSRISIALAIARVFPAGESTRKFAIGMAVIFASFFTAIIIYFSVLCSKKDAISITTSGSAQCRWTNALRVIITAANLLSDSALVAVPLYKLWRIKLPKRQRRLVLGGFAASIMTTVPTVGCAIFQFAPPSWDPARQDIRLKLSYFESGNAIMASNLLVIITYFDTVRRRAAEQSIVRQSLPETCQTRGSPPATHSNQVPPAAMLSTLYLTEISDVDAHYGSTHDIANCTTPSALPTIFK